RSDAAHGRGPVVPLRVTDVVGEHRQRDAAVVADAGLCGWRGYAARVLCADGEALSSSITSIRTVIAARIVQPRRKSASLFTCILCFADKSRSCFPLRGGSPGCSS